VHRSNSEEQQPILSDWKATLGWHGKTIYFSNGTVANGCYGPRKTRERSRRRAKKSLKEESCGTTFGI